MEIFGVLVVGIGIGLLGKLLAPGDRDNTPLWLTVLCGLVGALIGWIIFLALGGTDAPGLDWDCWALVIVCAAIPVAVASTLTGRRGFRVPR